MTTNRMHRNHNYSIGTDILADGRVRAKARGRKTSQRTFESGTTPQEAALTLAIAIERRQNEEREVEVRNLVTVGAKADWAIYVSFGA